MSRPMDIIQVQPKPPSLSSPEDDSIDRQQQNALEDGRRHAEQAHILPPSQVVHHDHLDDPSNGGTKSVGVCRGLVNQWCWKFFFVENNIARLLFRHTIDKDSLEDTVNAQALICALMLTIPYGLITNLGYDFWEKIEQMSLQCPEFGYADVRRGGLTSFLATVYCATGGLILSTVFYLLRPTDDAGLQNWWPRGRIFIVLLFLLTASTVVSLITFSNWFVVYYFVAPDHYCTESNVLSLTFSVGFLVALFILGVLFFF